MTARTQSVLLVAASAALYAASFPPLGLFPLAWIALVPLLLALAERHPLAGFALGVGWSLLVGLGTAFFLPDMIGTYFETSRPATFALAGALVLETGLLYGVFGAWIAWWTRRGPVSPLLVACAWGGCEWARTLTPLANPWALSGYSQVPFAHVMQLADLAGPFGVGMLVAAANAATAGLLRAEFRVGPPWRAAALAAAALLAAVGYGELRLRQPFATGAEVSLALVQAAVPAERRFDPQHLERSFALQTSLSLRAAEQRPSLILWPEYAIDFPLREGTPAWERLTRLSRLTGAELLVGALSLAGGSGQRSNSAFLVGETGPRDRYDKVELMPFAEWAPLGGPPRHGADYAAGVSARPLGSRAGPIGVLLCNEAMHSGHARKASLEGAEILANPANDAWFGPLGAAHQLDVVSVRAIENRRYLVRPTLTGQSAVVDAHGRVLTRTRYGETEVLAGVVRRSTAETPYQRFGAALPGAAGALALAASARRLRRRSTGGEA